MPLHGEPVINPELQPSDPDQHGCQPTPPQLDRPKPGSVQQDPESEHQESDAGSWYARLLRPPPSAIAGVAASSPLATTPKLGRSW